MKKPLLAAAVATATAVALLTAPGSPAVGAPSAASAPGEYTVVERPTRLVYTWRWEGMATETLVTVEFHPDGDGTRVDLVMIPIGGNYTMDPEGAAYALRLRRAGAERDARLVIGPPPSRAEAERLMALEVACSRREGLSSGTGCMPPY